MEINLSHLKLNDLSRKVQLNNFLHSQRTFRHVQSLKDLISIFQMKLLAKVLIWFQYIETKIIIASPISPKNHSNAS